MGLGRDERRRLKEAARVGYPMDQFVGIWWSGSEADLGRRGSRPRATSARTGTRSGSISRPSRIFRNTSSTRATRSAEGQGRRSPLQSGRLQSRSSSPRRIRRRAGASGKKAVTGEDVAARAGDIKLDARAEGDSGSMASRPRSAVLRRPLRPPAAAILSSGTAPSG